MNASEGSANMSSVMEIKGMSFCLQCGKYIVKYVLVLIVEIETYCNFS